MNQHSPAPQPRLLEKHPLPKGEPWPVVVDVILKSDANPQDPVFEIWSCLKTKEKTINGKQEDYLVFDNHGRKGFIITFQLHDETGKGYKFPNKDKDAVWSKLGTDCPTESSGKDEVFKNPTVITSAGDTLQVHFRNGADDGKAPGDFRYTLNVTTTGDEPYLALDPGGTGNNGQSFR